MVGRPGLIHTASDAANAAKLVALGITATPATPWTGTQQMTVGPHAFHWDGATWQPGAAGAVNAAPGSSYGARNDITAADAANASKLGNLGVHTDTVHGVDGHPADDDRGARIPLGRCHLATGTRMTRRSSRSSDERSRRPSPTS